MLRKSGSEEAERDGHKVQTGQEAQNKRTRARKINYNGNM